VTLSGKVRLILGGAIAGAVIGAVGAVILSRATSGRNRSRDGAVARRQSHVDIRRLVALGVAAVALVRQALEL
jgi:gas vesicle protein